MKQSPAQPQTDRYSRRLVIRGMQKDDMDGKECAFVFMCGQGRWWWTTVIPLPPFYHTHCFHSHLNLEKKEQLTTHLLPALLDTLLRTCQQLEKTQTGIYTNGIQYQALSQLFSAYNLYQLSVRMLQSLSVSECKPIHLCNSQLSRFKMDNNQEAQF